jgi:hypothetical protein
VYSRSHEKFLDSCVVLPRGRSVFNKQEPVTMFAALSSDISISPSD